MLFRAHALMSPDLLFWLSLATKMVVSAAFVVMASIVAEKAGPLIGAMVSTLPIGSGPAYIFLSLDHDVYFLEASTVASLAVHAASGVFGMVYVMLAQRRSLVVSMAGALAAWAVCAYAIRELTWTITTAALLNAVTYAICIPLARRYLYVMMPPIRRHWFDIPLRALLVAVLVGAVVEASATLGPKLTGILAVFPIVMTSLLLIMHPRIGGPASAAIIANTMWGLVGFATSVLALNLVIVPFGAPLGLTVALIVAMVANYTIFWFRRRSHARRMAAMGRPAVR